MKKKSDFDMRYANEQSRYQHAKETGQLETEPPPLYRADLLVTASRTAGGRLNYHTNPDFRNLAARTGLSVNTIRQALDGKAPKLETLKILANHFGINWIDLFDVDREVEKMRAKLAKAGSKKK